jgi:type I restriction enzyme S subunit
MSETLPTNWKEVQLEELICSLESGGRPKGGVKGILGGIPSVGGEYLSDNGGFKFNNIRYIPEKYYLTLNKGHIDHNDILIVKDGATTGKTSFVNDNFPYDKAVVNEHVFVLKISKQVISKVTFYYLWSEEGKRKILENFQGSAQGGINRQFIINTLVPLIPFNEQKLIAAKLDQIMPRIDGVKERLERIPQIIKHFRQSVLTAAVTGKLTEKWREEHGQINDWDEKISGKLFTFVTSGSRGWAKYYSDTGSLFLRIGNLDHFTINLDLKKKQYVNPPKGTEGTRTRVQPNDILISITADVGMVGIIPKNIGEAYINQHISLARPSKEIYPFFLAWYLASSEGQTQFQELQKGATKVGLGLEDIKNVRIPIPFLEEQKEIVRQVDKLFAFADKLEEHYQKAKEKTDKFPQSVLAKAFRGELVPQDPNDEPAEKLLERIKEEKARLESEIKKTRNKTTRKKK